MSTRLPRRINKGTLCRIIGLEWPSRVGTYELYPGTLTEEFITITLGLTIEEYKRKKVFSYTQTLAIYEHLKITEEEYQETFPKK